MAVYQFRCNDCEFIFEEDMPMSKASSHHYGRCPECTAPQPPRYYGSDSINFVLKGDGWPSKEIKAGKSPVGTKRHKPGPNTRAKKLDDVMNEREKAGMDPRSKEVPMSDDEFKRRKKLNQDWIDGKK